MDKKKLQEWTDKYGAENVMMLNLKDLNGESVVAYIHLPKVHPRPYSLYSRMLTHYKQHQTLEMGSLILNECWLGGDERVRKIDSMLHISAAIEVNNTATFLTGSSMISLDQLNKSQSDKEVKSSK